MDSQKTAAGELTWEFRWPANSVKSGLRRSVLAQPCAALLAPGGHGLLAQNAGMGMLVAGRGGSAYVPNAQSCSGMLTAGR